MRSRLNRSGLKEILRPVARFCLRHALKLQDVHTIMKDLMVEEAVRDLRRLHAEPSLSRITAMTGVNSKDVARFMHAVAAPAEEDIINRVIGYWRQSAEFAKANGKPAMLSFEGKNSEFSQLVRSVSQDLHPDTVLYELERIGAVVRKPKGLQLNARIHLIKGDKEGAFKLVSTDMDILLRAVEENIAEAEKMPNLHLRTEYDRVALKHESEIREWLIDEGSLFHAKAREFLAKFDCDLNPVLRKNSSKGRVVLGAFSWVEKPASLTGNRKDKKK